MKQSRPSERLSHSTSTLMKAITSYLMLTSIFTLSHCHFTANPKDYYAHRQRHELGKDMTKQFDGQQSIPNPYGSVMRSLTSSSAGQEARRIQQPSCASLRSLWKSSLKEISNQVGFFVFPNDLERILSNPYYRSLIRGPGEFGQIVREASDSRPSASDVVFGYERKYPGAFVESPAEPDQIASSYGHVVLSPDPEKAGAFGDIVVVEAPSRKQQERRPETNDGATGGVGNKQEQQSELVTASEAADQGSAYHSSTLARKQKSGNQNGNSGSLSAA